MYSPELKQRLMQQLAPDNYTPREESEAKYPKRNLSEGARVMRVPPSPTGLVHIGTIYAALINERLAHQSGGVFILRIEDTDKKREVEGAVDMIFRAFRDFEITYDEGPEKDAPYGPYFQSERGKIYLGYAAELLETGRAYPCFATAEELNGAIKDQQSKKLRPGYYGEWALWRDKTEAEVTAALDSDKPFVLRFRSEGSHNERVQIDDALKGKLELPENDLDVPLIKSDEYRLPTYHLAHVVDDHLMGTTLVLRGDEWLPSTPLHIELAEALGIKPFNYAHLAPISVIDKNGGGKRKLSKRKDPEADVKFWTEAGYPVEAVKAYLLGLANSNFEDWYRQNQGKSLEEFPVTLEKLAASRAPLLDPRKLEDYAKDYIASLPQEDFEIGIKSLGNEKLNAALTEDPTYTQSVLAIERDGDKPRKDLAKWSDAFEQYGYFFDSLFESDFKQKGHEEYLSDLDLDRVEKVSRSFLDIYDPNDSQEEWLAKIRAASEAESMGLADYARVIRVKLTGKNRTPDLYAILHAMGEDRVKGRLSM